MSREVRFILALFVGVMGLGLVAFGILRGASKSGPGEGFRLTVAIEPPLDPATVMIAEHAMRDRVEEKGAETRVIPAGDHLIIELGETDPMVIHEFAALIERREPLEIRAGDVPVLVPSAIAAVQADLTGVAITVRDPSALAEIPQGTELSFVYAGKLRYTAPADHVAGNGLHVRAGGLETDEGARIADDLVAIVYAGAMHPLHVTHEEPFTRATGALPRAWPFAVPGLVLLAFALLLRVPRRAKRAD